MEDNFRALKDFFENVYPEYSQSQFYITGESYAGVYIPMLAWRLVQAVDAGEININFKVNFLKFKFQSYKGDCNWKW